MTLITDRRSILGLAGAGAATILLPSTVGIARAASALRPKKFIFVILRGAADGLGMIEPRGDANFIALRQEIMAANPLRLDGYFALHPELKNLHKMFLAGEARLHHAVGTGYTKRSHFDGQNILESGGKTPYAIKTGWLNRMLPLLSDAQNDAIALAANVPLALLGPSPVASYTPVRGPEPGEGYLDRLARLYSQDIKLNENWTSAEKIKNSLMQDGVPGKQSIGEMAAKILSAENGPSIMTIDSSGWDTHSNQQRRLGNQLQKLDKLLAELKSGLGPTWSDTLILVASEFGRTAALNGTRGTDHGNGTAAFFAGGGLKGGGKITADWPGLATNQLYQGRDLRSTAALPELIIKELSQHYSVDAAKLKNKLFSS